MRKETNSSNQCAPNLPLGIGAPVWACGEWAGQVYPERTPRRDWLKWYSKTFNTVEGNSTFYALPPIETFEKWADQSVSGFQFCFKFPREISHDAQLLNCREATREFLRRLEVLAKANRLGPTFLQLGPAFGPERLEVLKQYLQQLPREFPWAVEVRHAGWYDAKTSSDLESEQTGGDEGGIHELRLNEMLSELKIDKVLFDSRPLYQSPPDDAVEAESQRRKPKTPIRRTVTAQRPMLRIVGRNRVALTDRFFEQWASIVAGWIREGLTPIVFTHAPDDAYAPELARRFLSALQPHVPGVNLSLPRPTPTPRQLTFLDE